MRCFSFHFSFYFVGDEDLLEIIGNSKNVPRLQKHFKKMFAGVHSVILDDDQTKVLGISAKEGEKVQTNCCTHLASHDAFLEYCHGIPVFFPPSLPSSLSPSLSSFVPLCSPPPSPSLSLSGDVQDTSINC